MDKQLVLFSMIASIAYCELNWWLVKTKRSTPGFAIGHVVKVIMWFNGFSAIFGSLGAFIFFYFISLYYFIIYRERGHELQSNDRKETPV